MTTLETIIRNDLERPVCRWNEADKQAWRDLYGRLPSRCPGCDGDGPCTRFRRDE